MSDQINKIPSGSPNFQTDAAQKLAELFPEIIMDGKVDITALQTVLGEDAATGVERFGLFWTGKTQAIRAAQTPTTATLAPDHENSVDWDTTQNIFIEGDNLEVLKVLQKHYYGQVKMIYIDPPYNTGNDFVYSDDYTDSIGSYLQLTSQSDEGGKLSTNSESAGRFHSNWLNMMYPRLKLARNLLTEDGVIFISIDDHEFGNLRSICDEIFGEENSLSDKPAPFIWPRSGATAAHAVRAHEYILGYARNKRNLPLFKLADFGENNIVEHSALKKISKANPPSTITLKRGMRIAGNDASFSGKIGESETMTIDGTLDFKDGILLSDTKVTAGWAMKDQLETWLSGEETFDTKGQRVLEFFFNEKGLLRYRKERGIFHPRTLLDRQKVGTTKTASKDIKDTLGINNPFPYAKPVNLIKYIVLFASSDSDIVLDFFAGSGTTAHAVLTANAEDGSSRRYISVQLPEPTDENSEARKAGYKTISEITRERIRRAGKNILDEEAVKLDGRADSLDVGFRAYKLVDTNFTKWKADSGLSEEDLTDLFTNMADSVADDARPEALLTEVLLKLGFSLTEKIEIVEVAGLTVFSVADGLVMAYLDEHTQPTLDQLRALVGEEPERLVILEDAFQGNDELKTNLVQECRTHNVDLWTA